MSQRAPFLDPREHDDLDFREGTDTVTFPAGPFWNGPAIATHHVWVPDPAQESWNRFKDAEPGTRTAHEHPGRVYALFAVYVLLLGAAMCYAYRRSETGLLVLAVVSLVIVVGYAGLYAAWRHRRSNP